MNPPTTQPAPKNEPLGNDMTVPSLPREPSDTELLDWLIMQGPPGAAEGIGLNDEAWECGAAHAEAESTDKEAIRLAIRAAMQGTTP